MQLGIPEKGGDKPKMASLLPNMQPEEVSLELALKLLGLPRTIGEHPESSEPVLAANGRFGPYVKCGEEIRSIPPEMSPLSISLAQAIDVLKQPKGQRRTAQPKALREMGKHPVSEKDLVIKSGRFGPYVTDGELNASLRSGMTPETLTIDDAVNLLEARAARLAADPSPRKRATKKATKKSTKKATKKRAAKKSTKSPASKGL